MGFVIGKLWGLAVLGAVLTIVCGVGVMLAAARTGSNALGQGAYGTKVFMVGIGDGWADAEAYDEMATAQAEKKRAAEQKKKAQQRKDAAKGSGQ